MAGLLIIDPDASHVDLLSSALAQPALEILTALDPSAGLKITANRQPQIVLMELEMPNLDGLEVLRRIVARDSNVSVILMTAKHSPETVVEAIREGAVDYVKKPVSLRGLRERIGNLVREISEDASTLLDAHVENPCPTFEGVLGRSQAMHEMYDHVCRVAPYYRSILIAGETGMGKDLLARRIHRMSRAAGRFVVLNCSAVVETLFESELFGYVRGVFTGATVDKAGLFEHAHGGTLFLDEIGDMPLATQSKLLRVLQTQEVQRVGALSGRRVNVRVIAATNQDLRALIANARFRKDLFYRLSMVELHVPSLAQRKEYYLALLERYFVTRFADRFQKGVRGLTPRAQIRLSQHAWPGNIRELENVIGYGVMMTTRATIDIADLSSYLWARPEPSPRPVPVVEPETGAIQMHGRLMVKHAFEVAAGNQAKAARFLRIGRDALSYKLGKYDLLPHRPHVLVASAASQ